MSIYLKIIILILIYVYIQDYNYLNNIKTIEIIDTIEIIQHTKENQKLISYDSDNYSEVFGEYTYVTNVYKTNKNIIAITSNVQKQNNNKYILWLSGTGGVFNCPFVTKELIKKGYDIYALDLPNLGFAYYDFNSYLKYPSVAEIIGYLNCVINFIDSQYNNPYRVIYGISLGAAIAMFYISLYPDVFSKCILNGPSIDDKLTKKDYYRALTGYISLLYDIDMSYINNTRGELFIVVLSMYVYDIRQYGITKDYIKNITDYFKTHNKLNPNHINSITGRPNLIVKSNEFLSKDLLLYHIKQRIVNTTYDIPTLILCSDIYIDETNVCLDYSKPDFGLSKFGDMIVNVNCIEENAKRVFTNYKLIRLENASHDVFYSKKTVRDKAIREFANFL